jgi:hypothetical protein
MNKLFSSISLLRTPIIKPEALLADLSAVVGIHLLS